jgi:hypothetical protein
MRGNRVVNHVTRPTNFLFKVFLGGHCSDYLATAMFDENVDNLVDTRNFGTHDDH